MFKKITMSDGSPMVIAEATWYVVAQDEKRYDEWFMQSMIETRAGLDDMSDAIDSICDADDLFILLRSVMPEDYPGVGRDVSYDQAMCGGMRILVGTKNGRYFNSEERRLKHSYITQLFCNAASTVGAIYMEMKIDGKRSFWYNDESCFSSCEVPNENLRMPTWEDFEKECNQK